MTMHRRPAPATSALLAAVALCCAAGCQTTWTPTTRTAPGPLQWPMAPAAAKVRYDRELTGIARDRSVGSVLQTIVVGTSEAGDAFALPVAVTTGSDGRIAVADTGCGCVHLY